MSRKRSISYKSKEGQRIKEKREEKFKQLQEIYEHLTLKKDKISEKIKLLPLLEDVCNGLYEETDKLFKKSAVEDVTDLTVIKVNEVIKDTKELVDTDIYIQRINHFEPAGDNPEVRDIVLVLNQLLKGLKRFEPELENSLLKIQRKKLEVSVLSDYLEVFLEEDEELDIEETDFGAEFPSWFDDADYFNFDKLDNTDLHNYFDYEPGKTT